MKLEGLCLGTGGGDQRRIYVVRNTTFGTSISIYMIERTSLAAKQVTEAIY